MKEYFSHDYNARNNEKTLELRAEFGAEGYGIFWMVIESIAESSNSSLDIKNIAGLSLSYGIAKDKLIILIDKMVELELLIKKETFIFSDRINEHKSFRSERSKTGKLGAEMKWKTVREKKEVFNKMKLFFNNTCVRCRGGSNLINVERDHIIPSYQDGIDEPANWQPLCARCNASKGSETIDHRIKYCEDLGLSMPTEWLSYGSAIANRCKEKKRKEKKSKVKEKDKEIYMSFQNAWNDEMSNKISLLNDKRKKNIDKLLKVDGEFLTHFGICISKIKENDFLLGKKGGWKANFDWLFTTNKSGVYNYIRVLEDAFVDEKDRQKQEILDWVEKE